MRELEPVIRVVVEKSVAKQVENLGLEAVLLIEPDPNRRYDVGELQSRLVLHRTGSDGWLTTRGIPGDRTPAGGYHKTRDVLAFVRKVEKQGCRFTVLHEGDGPFAPDFD